MIHFLADDVSMPHLHEPGIRTWMKTVAASYGKKISQLALVFCSDERILSVNKSFLQHDYFTDIITFDTSKGSIVSGELYISIDTVQSNSDKFQVSFEKELHRIIIHGLLHLCGEDDKNDALREAMRVKENIALDMLDEMKVNF